MFNVGDVVRCKEKYSCLFAHATREALLKVESVINAHQFQVKIIAHNKYEHVIGRTYNLNCDRFDLATDEDYKDFPNYKAPVLKITTLFQIKW